MKQTAFLASGLFLCLMVSAQKSAEFLSDKAGKYRYETNLPEKTYNLRNGTLSSTENLAFKKNVAALAEWYHQHHRMLLNPIGYDMRALTTWTWGDFTTVTDWEYGIPAELSFLFELFFANGSKWSIEPPQAEVLINHIAGGHDGWYFTPESVVEDGTRYDLSKSGAVQKALLHLQKYFMIFPFKGQLAPGVHEFEAFQGGRKAIVVFNPDRPPFWLPVTVKEMADTHLAYYSLFQKLEIDRMVLDQLKKEIAELSPEELAAPAHSGHDSHFVLKVNGQGQGLQIMKFNPEYWDRSLPKSAIQFLTFWTSGYTEEEKAEDLKARGYPDYPVMFVNQIDWSGAAGLINKK
jgi:hypothetical protein